MGIILVKNLFPLINLMDNPKKYGHDRSPVPYPAGIIIPILYFLLSISYWPESMNRALIGFLIASIILSITCFIDDRKGLSPFLRLAIQGLCALIIIASGIGIHEIRIPFGENFSLNSYHIPFLWGTINILADLIAFIWIIFMINSLNWLDGISGITSSVSASSALVLAITAWSYGQSDIAILFIIFAVICATFFIFDLESPKILMGDSGSMFLGLSLAVFTLIAGAKLATLMIIMFAPLFDAVFTIFRRIVSKKSPFKGDLKHLHHRLLDILPSKRHVVLCYATCTAILGVLAIFLGPEGKLILLAILSIVLTIIELKTKPF